MIKLYVVCETNIRDKPCHLIAETGEHLYTHICSDPYFAKGDLIENRHERIAECQKRFGDYQVLMLGEDDMTREKLLRLNNAWNPELVGGGE